MDDAFDGIREQTRPALETWLAAARERLEAMEAEARQLRAEVAAAVAWLGEEEPAAAAPRAGSSMTLHGAMELVLRERGNEPMRPADLAREVADRDLYTMRDGKRANAHGIQSRVNAYFGTFVREGGLIRLKKGE